MSATEFLTMPSEHDGLSLAVAMVLPDGAPKALVQFAHGMAEHKERYLPLMEWLAARGYACIINDHRGHGGSVKTLQDLGYFYRDGGRGLIRDLHQVAGFFRAKYPALPYFLVGHSMGSLAAREYAAKYGRELDGVVLSGSPGMNDAAGAGLALTRLIAPLRGGERGRSALLDRLINGSFNKRFRGGSKFAWLSANPDNVAAYEADPLCGFPFTINGYRALLNLMRAAYDTRTTIRRNLPVHFMSGEDDPCAPDRAGLEGAVRNLRDRGCASVTSKMYPGLRHEIFNEGQPEVWEDLARTLDAWTDATLQKAPAAQS